MLTHRGKSASVILLLVWLSGTLAQDPVAAGYETPLASVTALHEGLIAAGRDERASVHQRYQLLAPIVSATHDIPFIAQFATRRYWGDFNSEQREVFVEQFSRLSSMTYAARFVSVSTDTFHIEKTEELTSGRAQVMATIRRDAQPDIPIEYLLHETPTGWKIINVIADGVSDLALKRAEYRAV
ncbi:MAG: ABC transporter substrate-binding protein, partial [Gammaproteobacteria bacterium]